MNKFIKVGSIRINHDHIVTINPSEDGTKVYIEFDNMDPDVNIPFYLEGDEKDAFMSWVENNQTVLI